MPRKPTGLSFRSILSLGARRSVAAGWDGFGLAVQAYQKRARAVIEWLADAGAPLDAV